MKAFIVSNGEMFDDAFYLKIFRKQNPDYIICADGGANHVRRLGIIPSTIIGDLDSITTNDLEFYESHNIEILKYPPEKDDTDTQLAIQYAMSLPVKEIVLLGVLGDRIDHSLANIYLMENIINKGFKVSIINEKNIIYLINKEIEIKGKKGDIVSLLPYTDRVKGITTMGMYYSLEDSDMIKSKTYGISNIFNDEYIKISIKSGLLLVILARD
jgi:thiamine pyrophosphokinase